MGILGIVMDNIKDNILHNTYKNNNINYYSNRYKISKNKHKLLTISKNYSNHDT
jgi:hypothetical protein